MDSEGVTTLRRGCGLYCTELCSKLCRKPQATQGRPAASFAIDKILDAAKVGKIPDTSKKSGELFYQANLKLQFSLTSKAAMIVVFEVFFSLAEFSSFNLPSIA